MGFLDKLKKTLWKSFFGKPERQQTSRRKPKQKALAKKKKKSQKKIASSTKIKAPRKAASIKFKKQPKAEKKKITLPGRKGQKDKKSISSPKGRASRMPNVKVRSVKPQVPQGVLIGRVTHFFPQVHAAAIKIEAQNLSVGDEILFKGATTHFKIRVDSMQINRVPVTQAVKGSEIGILVKKRVREGDEVFKL